MSEMIERVVKSMDAAAGAFLDNHAGCVWEDIPLDVFARAAIEAMREPTPEMLGEGYSTIQGDLYEAKVVPEAADIWQAMIDAALSEKP